MLVCVTQVPGDQAPATSQPSSSSNIVPEQEDVWESDIYPPEAWEGAAYYKERQSRSSWQRHKFRPSVDTGGEIWETDLYSPEAWESGVEGHDQKIHMISSSTTEVDPPSNPPPREEVHNEVFWPNIESYISRPSGPKPTVHCVICHISQLVIVGLQERDSELTQEEREVLSCGHVVGADCFEKWEAVASRPVKCPVCNAVVD